MLGSTWGILSRARRGGGALAWRTPPAAPRKTTERRRGCEGNGASWFFAVVSIRQVAPGDVAASSPSPVTQSPRKGPPVNAGVTGRSPAAVSRFGACAPRSTPRRMFAPASAYTDACEDGQTAAISMAGGLCRIARALLPAAPNQSGDGNSRVRDGRCTIGVTRRGVLPAWSAFFALLL